MQDIAVLDSDSVPTRLMRFSHRLFDSNPFYLLSALLLIYSIYSISVGPQFFATESREVIFNFFSLETYSVMLVVTAIFLARKQIWYDSALLVVLANILILIPFMLLSHASFLENELAVMFCLVGSCLAITKTVVLKRCIGGTNLPGRLLLIATMVLALNVALPLVFRRGLNFGQGEWTNNELWRSRSLYCWYFVLPVIVFLGNLLPKYRFSEKLVRPHEKQWLPLLVLGLWIIGSTIHLYSIGYIDDQKFSASYFVPLLWSVSWLFYTRIASHIAVLGENRFALLLIPASLPGIALLIRTPALAIALFGINSLLFAYQLWKSGVWKLIGTLCALSLLGCALSVPDEWIRPWIIDYGKHYLIGALVALVCVITSFRTRTAKGALAGSIAFGIIGLGITQGSPISNAILLQLCVAYILVHSLWWREPRESGSNTFLAIAFGIWAAHSFALQKYASTLGTFIPCFAAAVLLTFIAIRTFVFGRRFLVLAAGACCIMVMKPICLLAFVLRGMLPLAASFILFGFGTAYALHRHRVAKAETP